MRDRVRAREQRKLREDVKVCLEAERERENLSWTALSARLTRRMCEAQQPVIEPDERIVFTRTSQSVPNLCELDAWKSHAAGRTLHELGPISNICAGWEGVLADGLAGRRRIAEQTRERLADDTDACAFLDAAMETMDAVLDLAARYAGAAREADRNDVAEVLERVPAEPPRTFWEALQSLRLLHAVVWLSGHYHVGLGRFDQTLWPYLKADLDAGRLTEAEAEELVCEFFITLNKDSDLYPGIQQGDNGQSMMLGGVTRSGADAVNPLTWMALRAAREVGMIDPKINLRVTADTDLKLLTLASELTRMGLGFPQYSNDAVVVPAMVAHGYDLEDARDYAVAACWEFIIPGKGMEIVNVGAVSFPAAVDKGIREGLAAQNDMDGILARVEQDVKDQLANLAAAYRKLILPPAPYYSVLMDGCLESGRDLSEGLRYNNYGIHGACASNAADALAAVERFVFEDGTVERGELVNALVRDYANDEPLRRKLFDEGPKVGNADPAADTFLVRLFEMLADACEAEGDNGRNGRFRAGSGSAMYYVWLARGAEGMREPEVGATSDGRHAGDLFSANLAPSPGIRVAGPISILQSFAKIDYGRICNGGPVTMELADSVFRNEESLRKVALLVQIFARLGCQQLQLNTLNVDTLRDAQQCPQKHPNLIVRVWGWSGYFCELDTEYQEHIIQRHIHGM